MNKFANLNRRRHTPSEKLEIVLEALKKERSVAQLALQFEINANQLTRWINVIPPFLASIKNRDYLCYSNCLGYVDLDC